MSSKRIPVTVSGDDLFQKVFDMSCAQGWGDGLPVIPPTPDRVASMMSTVSRAPDEVVAELLPRRAEATIEKLAINAVMAGCLPDYFPVVVAAVEALADPKFNLRGVNTTTNPVAPLIIVNGPIRERLNINGGYSVLGPGWQANATIGRAVSLCMLNVAGRLPGEICKATYKHPGAFTMCMAELEERSPWEPLHRERAFSAEQSTVTVVSATGTTNILDSHSQTADSLLKIIAGSMLGIGSNNVYPLYGLGEMVLIICPDHARLIASRYPTKVEVKRWLADNTLIPLSLFPPDRIAKIRQQGTDQIQEGYARLAADPGQFLLVVAGGPGGYHSCFVPTFGDSHAITRPIVTNP